jgi:hypothetical protein
MKMDNTRPRAFIEMATNGIARHRGELDLGVGFSEDGVPQRARCVATFGSFFHKKNNLIHGMNPL